VIAAIAKLNAEDTDSESHQSRLDDAAGDERAAVLANGVTAAR